MQPIYKGHDKDITDPASYRGKYLNNTFGKLFEVLLLARLTIHTELNNTLTFFIARWPLHMPIYTHI